MTPPVKVPRVSLTNPIRDVVDTRTLQALRRLGVVRETRIRNLVIVMQWRQMRTAGVRSYKAILALAQTHCLSPEQTRRIVYEGR